jgi:hypothetical protein
VQQNIVRQKWRTLCFAERHQERQCFDARRRERSPEGSRGRAQSGSSRAHHQRIIRSGEARFRLGRERGAGRSNRGRTYRADDLAVPRLMAPTTTCVSSWPPSRASRSRPRTEENTGRSWSI